MVTHLPKISSVPSPIGIDPPFEGGCTFLICRKFRSSISAWKAFYLDPSHVRPVPAEALAFLAEAAGFTQTRIEYHAPLPAAERLEERSENDAKLNRLLFAEQDYALVARVPRATND